jgi:hypothetical protein
MWNENIQEDMKMWDSFLSELENPEILYFRMATSDPLKEDVPGVRIILGMFCWRGRIIGKCKFKFHASRNIFEIFHFLYNKAFSTLPTAGTKTRTTRFLKRNRHNISGIRLIHSPEVFPALVYTRYMALVIFVSSDHSSEPNLSGEK